MRCLPGLISIIPAVVLLAVSFFVLFAVTKAERQGLKVFGYTTAALLWVVALLVFSTGVYAVFSGRQGKSYSMQEMMKGRMHGMMKGPQAPPMMREQTDNPVMKR